MKSHASAPVSRSEQAALGALFGYVFESIPRTDQRRWAECYVTGLSVVPGRKSIRRIAEGVEGETALRSVAQCLQQFVNQSPWDWSLVRRDLVRAVGDTVRPCAWVVQEVEFVKDGRSSVGVWSQYAPGLRRTVNCQMADVVWLVGDGGWVPADWRLMLPKCWDADEARRTKARVPETERHRPAWEYVLDVVDEMAGEWGLEPCPVVTDLRHQVHHLDPLVTGLEQRELEYMVRITDRAAVGVHSRTRRVVQAGEVMRHALREHALARWGRSGGHGLSIAQAVLPPAPGTNPTGPGYRPRRLVALRPTPRNPQGGLWYTNLPVRTAVDLLSMVDDRRGDAELAALRSDSGLDHFEGRSYRGWHHHVTLASIAHAGRVCATDTQRAAA